MLIDGCDPPTHARNAPCDGRQGVVAALPDDGGEVRGDEGECDGLHARVVCVARDEAGAV